MDPRNNISLRDILVGETNAYINSFKNASLWYSFWNRSNYNAAVQYLNDHLKTNQTDNYKLFIAVYDYCQINNRSYSQFTEILKSGLLLFVSSNSSFTHIDDFYKDIKAKEAIDALHQEILNHLTPEERNIPYLMMPLIHFRDFAKKDGDLDYYVKKVGEYISPHSVLPNDTVREHLSDALKHFQESQNAITDDFTIIPRG